MTVLVREELNEADLAWAAADPSVAGVIAQNLSARAAMAAEWPFGRVERTEPVRRPWFVPGSVA